MGPDLRNANGRSLEIEDALKNAGSAKGRAFRVPSILGDEGGDR
jgi:aspartyl-tRNA(Asn)/glutamyl-tRNA(Gln) amidotransferase subunit C